MAEKKKILIIGCNGQVGSELIRAYTGEETLILADISKLDGVKHPFISVDLSDEQSTLKLVRESKPNIIINTAAYTAVDKAEEEQILAEKVNAQAPGILAEEAKKIGAILIHYSTDYVFDGEGEHKQTELEETDPKNVYGRTKLKGEKAIERVGGKYFIFRTSWVFSSFGNNFVKTMLRLGTERESLSVVSDQIGAPTAAHVLARATKSILDNFSADGLKDRFGLYHVTCAEEASWHSFAEEIFSLARKSGAKLAIKDVQKTTTDNYPTPATRPLNSRLDCSKFEKTFQITLPTWKKALEEVVQDIVNQAK